MKLSGLYASVTWSSLAFALTAVPAAAQDAAETRSEPLPAANEAEEESGVNVIFVTARKRSESIQDTPISITAFDAGALEARNATGLDSLGQFTPNLTINNSAAFSGSSQTAAVFIRGIGQTDFTLNTDPGVGTYVDGVYISRAVGGLLDLGDVERIEILRGPQGTLFGKNTIGGAINITTRRPTFDVEGSVSALYGSDDWVRLTGNISGPLSENVAAKLFARYETRDGFVTRTTDDLDLGNKDRLDLRAGLLFEPTDNFELLVNGDYSRSRENGIPLVPVAINPDALFAVIHNSLVAPGLEPELGARAFYNQQFVPADPFTVEGNFPSYSDADVWGLSANAELELGAVTLRSITAYRDVDSSFARDGDGSPLQVNSTIDEYSYTQFSQEFQLLGSALSDRLNYILGIYYLQEKGDNANFVDFGFVEFLSGGRVETDSYAAFAQLDYEIVDGLTVTAGIRYTDESRDFTPDQRITQQRLVLPVPPFPPLNFPVGFPLVEPGTYSVSANEWTPMVNVAWEPSEDLLLYGTFSRGFKGAGFTQRVYPPNLEIGPMGPTGNVLPPPSFDPETVNVYEAGLKFSSPDNRILVNAAAFYTDYSDLQVTVQVGVAPTTQNAAAASVRGFELEGQIVPVDGLRFEFGAGYTDAQYDRIDTTVVGITLDSRLPGTSEWTFNAAASYEIPIGASAMLTPRVDYSYRSSFFFDANNAVGNDGYGIWNAALAFDTGESGIEIVGFVKNIGDKLYFTHGESIFDPAGFTTVSPARLREWGIGVTKRF